MIDSEQILYNPYVLWSIFLYILCAFLNKQPIWKTKNIMVVLQVLRAIFNWPLLFQNSLSLILYILLNIFIVVMFYRTALFNQMLVLCLSNINLTLVELRTKVQQCPPTYIGYLADISDCIKRVQILCKYLRNNFGCAKDMNHIMCTI